MFGLWRSMSVYLLMLPSSVCDVFPFPFRKAQFIGNFYQAESMVSTLPLLKIRE
jgi:hypothetical protein